MPSNSATPSSATVINSPDEPGLRFDARAAVRLALARAGLSEKEAAYRMGMDPATFSRQLTGQHHLAFDHLLRLPVEWWREFLALLAPTFGMRVESAELADVALGRAAEAFAGLATALQAARVSRR